MSSKFIRSLTLTRPPSSALSAANPRLLDNIECLEEATFVVDLDDIILGWNRRAECLFGVSAEDAVGVRFRDLEISYRIPLLRLRLEQVKRDGASATLPSLSVECPDGNAIVAMFRLQPLRDSELAFSSILVQARDPSPDLGLGRALEKDNAALADAVARAEADLEKLAGELEVTNEELMTSNEELEATNQTLQASNTDLETALAGAARQDQQKDEFLAVLAHELRNPLNVISNGMGILGRIGSTDERAARTYRIVSRQVRHLTELADELLDVARVTSGKITLVKRPLDIAMVAKTCLLGFRESGRTAHHDVVLDVESVWANADETRVDQIVTNLVTNAVKFTPPGGTIRVTVRSDGHDATIRVQDSGIGIPTELLPRIFLPFVQGEDTVHRAQGGLGLGLMLTRRLSELHGGTIDAASEGRGQGAVFTVRLPMIDEPDHADNNDCSPKIATGDRRRVLVVEDDEDGRQILRGLLELQGHEVYDAADGPAGVRQAEVVVPDIALLDIGLPGFDGFEVARRIRATGGRAWLVAMTGYGQPEGRERAAKAGFDAYLVKPLNDDVLAEIIEKAPRASIRGS
jgi:PAS domain S-box-containing protein